MQTLMIDLDIACSDYTNAHKPIKGAHGYGAELNLVTALYDATIQNCPSLTPHAMELSPKLLIIIKLFCTNDDNYGDLSPSSFG